MTYGRLMKRFRVSRGRGVVGVIGEIDRHEADSGAPGFAAIVVRKDTGYPGGGFFCSSGLPATLRRPKSRGPDPRLSDEEKTYVRELQEETWAFYGGRHGSGEASA